LKSIGKATDYTSRKKMYEDLGLNTKYGGFTGTAQQNIGLIENLGYKPETAPTSSGAGGNIAGSGATPSTTTTQSSGGINISGLSPLQQTYAQSFMNAPSEGKLYEKYSAEMGIPETEKIITGLSQSIMGLEDKINKVEGDVNARMGDFQVTEAQRRRLQNVEEQPLRTQYLESVRQKSYQEAGLSSKQNLLSTRLKYATEEAQRPLELMKTMIDWEEKQKASNDQLGMLKDIADMFKAQQEEKPEIVTEKVDNFLTAGAGQVTAATVKATNPAKTAGIIKTIPVKKPVWQMSTAELKSSLTGGK
jgi:hypothetical protein